MRVVRIHSTRHARTKHTLLTACSKDRAIHSTELDLLLAEHVTVGGMDNTFERYAAALQKREALTAKLHAREQRASVVDQLVTFLSLHIPNPDGNPQVKAIREASSIALLGVAAVVKQES